jgi:hypothetical protein
MSMPNLHRIYLTKVDIDVECDTFYPEFDKEDFNIVRLVNVNTCLSKILNTRKTLLMPCW